jgi:hypothetical protein
VGSVETMRAGRRGVLSQIHHFGQHTNFGIANVSQQVFNLRLLSVDVLGCVASSSCCLHALQMWRFAKKAKDSLGSPSFSHRSS